MTAEKNLTIVYNFSDKYGALDFEDHPVERLNLFLSRIRAGLEGYDSRLTLDEDAWVVTYDGAIDDEDKLMEMSWLVATLIDKTYNYTRDCDFDEEGRRMIKEVTVDVKTLVRDRLYDFVGGALEAKDEDWFIAEWGTDDAFVVRDSEGNEMIDSYPGTEDIVKYLRDIYRAVHMDISEMRQLTGLSQAAFAHHYCIPRRSVENWEAHSSSARHDCPIYVKLFLAQIIGVVDIF